MAVYTRPHKRKLAKRSRTLPVYGEGADKGKYFRCWNCGWICNVDRDELGDSDSSAGDEHTDYHQTHHCSTYDNYDGTVSPISGQQVVLNGTFAFDTDWTKGTGWTIIGGKAVCDGSQVATSNLSQSIGLVDETVYAVTYTISDYGAGIVQIYLGSAGAGTQRSANGTYTENIKCSGAPTTFHIVAFPTFVGKVDDITAYQCVPSPRPASRYAVLGGDTGHYQVAQNIVTPDGVAKTIRHEYTSDISRGCAFCGTLNWRGDY